VSGGRQFVFSVNSRDKAVIKVYNVPQKSDALYSAEESVGVGL